MENFPIEIVEHIVICPEMSIKDVVNLSLTCRKLQEVIFDNNTIWKKKFFQKWPQLQNKLESEPVSFYYELRHISELQKRTRALLESMPEKFYKKVELSETDLIEWDEILREKWDNYFYLTSDLMEIVHTKKLINSADIIPLNTPGNLTQKYYAAKALRHIRQIYLSRMWQRFIKLPPERQLLEMGAVIIAQWCQPNLEIVPEQIYNHLDDLTEMVKCILKRDHPDHPLFKATKKQFDLWRVEIRPDNEWCPSDCRTIIAALTEFLFRHMGFMGYSYRDSPFNVADEDDSYINVVLKTRKGMSISLAIIFDGIGRRLGLRCEPVIFPSHFLLRFCESQRPDSDWYYIDVFNGGKIIRNNACPYSLGQSRAARNRIKFPTATSEEVIVSIANALEHLARQAYSPSGRVTRLRSTLELIQLLNPKDISALLNLGKLYMLHNFNTTPLENFLLSHTFAVPEQAESLVQMLRNHQPDPPDDPTGPVERPSCVKFAVGMVMYHLLFGYKCVIFNWDATCLAAADWKWRNNVGNLRFGGNQPFYNALAEDGSLRYVAQENLKPIYEPQPLQLNDEVGRHFSHYYQTHYVPNAQTERLYPYDKAVRLKFHEEFVKPIPINM